MALNRDVKSVEEPEQEDEADEYARHGIVSPTAIKAARWLSRLLWLAMSGLVVFLLFNMNQSVPLAKFEELGKQHAQVKADLKQADAQVSEVTGPILAEASKLGLVQGETMSELSLPRLLQEIIDAGKKSRAREEADALVIVELAKSKVAEGVKNGSYSASSGNAIEGYRKAKGAQRTEALAVAAFFEKSDSKEVVEFFNAVAVATTGSLAERVIAIRWLGEKCTRNHVEAMKVLDGLQSEVSSLVASEAASALAGLK